MVFVSSKALLRWLQKPTTIHCSETPLPKVVINRQNIMNNFPNYKSFNMINHNRPNFLSSTNMLTMSKICIICIFEKELSRDRGIPNHMIFIWCKRNYTNLNSIDEDRLGNKLTNQGKTKSHWE